MNNICNKINYFTDSLAYNDIDTGCLCGCYNLYETISGTIVKNDLYSIDNQYYISGSDLLINEDLNVGILTPSGSQNFYNNTSLKIINNLTGEKIGVFIDFELARNSQNSKYDLLTLKSSSPQLNDFILNFELNKYNNLFLKYYSTVNGQQYNFTAKSKISFDSGNLLGINITNSKIFLSYFDFPKDEVMIEDYEFQISGKKDISFGKYFNSSFNGKLNNILLFKDFIDINYNKEILKTFLKTGEKVIYETVSLPISSGKISGFLNPTGILGSGITGYETSYNNLNINNDLNLNLKSFASSGVTGFLTGEKIEYSGTLSGLSSTKIYKYNLYDLNESRKYVKNNILFLNKDIDDFDFVELQIYSSFSSLDKLSYMNSTSLNLNKLNDRNNIYVNGLYLNYSLYDNLGLLESGNSVDSTDIIDNFQIFNNFSKLNSTNYYYDETTYSINGDWNLLPTNENLTGTYSIYLNGLKLSENLDYKILYSNYNNKNQAYLNINQASGIVNIIEDNYLYKTTGFFKDMKNIINDLTGRKIIFINGLIQNANSDYIEYFSENISGYYYSEPNNNTIKIFENEYSKFNKG